MLYILFFYNFAYLKPLQANYYMNIKTTKMNKSFISKIFAIVLMATATSSVYAGWTDNLSPYDLNAPVGWGTVDGKITGGEGGTIVTVKTKTELMNALKGTDKKIIYVDGEIEFSGLNSVKGTQNKTVYGMKGSALVNSKHSGKTSETGILQLSDCKNIILRNLTFKSAGAYDIDGNDNLTVAGSSYIWVDHCDFQDGVDGNFDCVNGSDNISVTWCRFRYFIEPWAGGSGGANDHRNCDLWGNSDSRTTDAGHLKTTFANCWWDEGCSERMPRVRYGQVHVQNCLYSSSNANYCVGYGYKSNLYVEACAFISDAAKKTPWKNYATKSGKKDYNITTVNNLNAKDFQSRSGSADYFIPSDHYTLKAYDSSLVEEVLTNENNGAGATLDITSTTDGIDNVAADNNGELPVCITYYNINGTELQTPQPGINIVKMQYADGRTVSRKVKK